MKRNTVPTAKMTREESIQKYFAALGGEDWETASHR